MKKAICSVLLALCLLAGLAPVPVQAAKTVPWDGSVAEAFAGGEGTEKKPYKIASGAQLALLAKLVNEGNEDYNAACYVLTADIDLAGGGDRQWTPIGTSDGTNDKPFYGRFDGKGHTVSRLFVDGGSSGNCIGLFGYIRNGTVANVTVSGSVSGWKYVGGIAGRCVSGSLGGASITGCRNCASVSGYYDTGGVVGCNQTVTARNNAAEVSDCVNAGAVYGQFDRIGGVAGSNNTNGGVSRVIRCMNAGRVQGGGQYIGGIVGENSAENNGSALVSNCYNTGTVTWQQKSGDVSKNGKRIGGVTGRNYASFSYGLASASPYAGTLYCYSAGPVDGREQVGGVVGSTTHSGSSKNTALVKGCRFLQTDTVNAGLPALNKGNGRVEDNISLSVKDFSNWSKFSGWDSKVWTMGSGLDPQLCSVTARPVLTGVEEPDPPSGEVPVMGISLNRTEWTILAGDWNSLKATLLPLNATAQTVTWSSSDPAVITVDEEGRFDAVAPGVAEITAAAGDCSAVCTVTVVPAILKDLECYTGEDGSMQAYVWAEAADREKSSLLFAAYGPGGVFLGAEVQSASLRETYTVPEGAETVRAFVLDDQGRPLAAGLEAPVVQAAEEE